MLKITYLLVRKLRQWLKSVGGDLLSQWGKYVNKKAKKKTNPY